jgi:hypothetical protein
MRVALVVAVRVGLDGCGAEAAGRAQVPLEKVPRGLRRHEGLVVETSRDQAREPAIDRPQVEREARASVDGARAQALDEAQLGHSGIRHRAGAVEQLHQRVGLLHTRAENAARAVVLPAACDERHAIGQQRGGERVAREALVRTAVEREPHDTMAIDATAGRQTSVHAPPSSWRWTATAAGGASPIFHVP